MGNALTRGGFIGEISQMSRSVTSATLAKDDNRELLWAKPGVKDSTEPV
jgi:hypothetical protein